MASHVQPRRIVVGIDGSDNALTALAWAAEQCRRSGGRVEAVFAWQIPALAYGAPGYVTLPPDFMTSQATSALDKALASIPPGAAEVTTLTVEGRAADCLVELSKESDVAMVVVGARGSGGLTGLLLGSVSHTLTHHCPKPLVIVPPGWDEMADGLAQRPVLVGLDGTPGSQRAFEWAADEARRRHATVLAVRAEEHAGDHRAPTGWLEQQVIDQVTAAGIDGVEVACRVELGRPAPVLVREAGSAQLLVIGSRHIGRAHELVGGSVGHAVTAHCPIPAVVVPPPT